MFITVATIFMQWFMIFYLQDIISIFRENHERMPRLRTDDVGNVE